MQFGYLDRIKTFGKYRQQDTYTHAHIPHRWSIMADCEVAS